VWPGAEPLLDVPETRTCVADLDTRAQARAGRSSGVRNPNLRKDFDR
jgi:hypothetical protein